MLNARRSGPSNRKRNAGGTYGAGGVGEGGKMVSLPRPWGVLGNGDVEELGERDKGGSSPPASMEKGHLWRWKERRQLGM